MSKLIGPIEVNCDAPDYVIVQACRQVGLQAPEDVCWRRIRNFLTQRARGGGLLFELWKKLRFWNIPAVRTCTCGRAFPELKKIIFTFNTGEVEAYFLGQCDRCHSVFWESAC